MRRLASEIIRNLESRIARLEKQSARVPKYKLRQQQKLKDFIAFCREHGLKKAGDVAEIADDVEATMFILMDGHTENFKYLRDGNAMLNRKGEATLNENKDMRVACLEKSFSSTRTAGNRYDNEDWVFFIHNEYDLASEIESEEEAEKLREKFEDCIERLCDKNRLSICDDDGLSRVAFLAFASIVGHTTGLWDHDHAESEKLEKLVMRDRKCGDLAEKIDNLPYDLGLA